MHITDPIADMLTRIRNANNAKHDTVDIPASNMKKAIAQILLDEGYIKAFQTRRPARPMSAAKSWHLCGKEERLLCLESVECPSLSPAMWK